MKLPHLHQFNYAFKITFSLFLLCIGFGMLQGQAYLVLVLNNDGEISAPGLDSITKHYYVPPVPILQHAIDGSMKDEVETSEDRKILEDWMAAGAPKSMYEEKVHEIIERSCIDCHSTGGEAEFSNFENFKELQKLAIFSYKPYLKKRLRKAHPHMLAIPVFILPTVLLLGFTALSHRAKIFFMGAPLLGAFVDVLGWFVTMVYPSAAFMILIGGMLCHGGTYFAMLINIYHLWLYKPANLDSESHELG